MRRSTVLSLNPQIVFPDTGVGWEGEGGSMDHKHNRIHRLLIGTAPAALFWLSSYVNSQRLAVVPQSGQKIYFVLLFTTSLEIQIVKLKSILKFGKKIVGDRVRNQNMGDLSVFFFTFYGETYV
jgi:hypothetical protein